MDDQTAGTTAQDPYAVAHSIAVRRRALGLTRQEVADRAGVLPEYLDYLEDQPVSIPRSVMARIAVALDTDVTQLTGPVRHLRPDTGDAARPHRLVDMNGREAREHLEACAVGRIGFSTDPGGPRVIPVNYHVVDGMVVFRTAPDSSLADLTGTVAFEVDHLDDERRLGWSVLVLGQIRRVTDAAEQLRLATSVHETPWPGEARRHWMAVEPTRVTGRRIETL